MFIVETVTKYIVELFEHNKIDNVLGQKMILMVESMPEKELLEIADAVNSYMLKDNRVNLMLKIAKALTNGWSTVSLAIAKRKDWLSDRDNLTYYRSLSPKPERFNATILFGSDVVTDSSSLADFHRCNMKVIWDRQMKRSFSDWIIELLDRRGITIPDPKGLKSFDNLIMPLIDYGKGDLITISDWMQGLDLSYARSYLQVKEIILENMGYFDLPKFSGFPVSSERNLAPYIRNAIDFFNYTMFIEEARRKRAITSVVNLREIYVADSNDVLFLEGENVRGVYKDCISFLDGLLKYIQDNEQDERERLLTCDFVTIIDKILRFKPKIEDDEGMVKISKNKISGHPVEMVLNALWDVLYNLARKKEVDNYGDIERIVIRGESFKHDLNEWQDIDANHFVNETEEIASSYLKILVGGIDNMIKTHLNLENDLGLAIDVDCSLFSEEVTYRYSATAESEFLFSVQVFRDKETKLIERKYGWALPEEHSYRLASDTIKKAIESMNQCKDKYFLPVFNLPYYEELFQTSSGEDICQVFLNCIREVNENSFMRNLLTDNWLKKGDPLLLKLKSLAEKYHLFINEASKKGIIQTLFSNEWTNLRQEYEQTLDSISSDESLLNSPMAGMLVRTFLIVNQRKSELGDSWYADKFEPSGIVTVLHPALLEMFAAQIVYELSCFNYSFAQEIEKKDAKNAFKKSIWQSYLDLAAIRNPLTVILSNEYYNLDISVKGSNLIYKIGHPRIGDDHLSTRMLLNISNYEEEDFDDIPDSELFKETRESKQLKNILSDYVDLHPHAKDGLSISVYRNKGIQPIIAAVNSFIKETQQKKKEEKGYDENKRGLYSISVTIFTDSADEGNVSRWVELWQERWEAAESETKYEVYRSCKFSIAHRMIRKDDRATFLRMISDSFETDIVVLYDFIGAGSGVNRFETVDSFDIRKHSLTFPILEKSMPTIKNPAEVLKRARIISNRQFSIAAAHARLMHSLKNDALQTGTVVIGSGDFKPWTRIIDSLHKKAEWVVCIDPSIDDKLIKESEENEVKEREIIGFGSGIGSSGEDNFTISTEQFSLKDIEIRLRSSIKSLFATSGWNNDEYDSIAKGILSVSRQLSGLSLVRATSITDQHIRDFMSYSLVRKILKTDEELLCDSIISLDAYRHWFDFSERLSRPDLLWIKAKLNENNRLFVNLHLVECKMGANLDNLLIHAKNQIENGLNVLVSSFKPIDADKNDIDDNRPDRRYWWMQLHRLIAAKSEINRSNKKAIITALERLAEGDFVVQWHASVFAFWTNYDGLEVKKIGSWQTSQTTESFAGIYKIGKEMIKHYSIADKEDIACWEENSNKELPADEDVLLDFEGIDSLSEKVEREELEEPIQLEPEEEGGDIEDIIDVKLPDEPDKTVAKTYDKEENQTIPTQKDSISGEVSTTIPARILLGRTYRGREVYWEFGHESLANRHALVFGTSGMGKTYAIQCILCELAKQNQNSLILDYTDGFLPTKIEDGAKKYIPDIAQNFIRESSLPINPFESQVSYEAGKRFEDTPDIIAKRVASIFKNVYGLGVQQFPLTIDVIREGLEKFGDKFDLDKLLDWFFRYLEHPLYAKQTVQTTITKIRPFITSKPFSESSAGVGWKEIFTNSSIRNRVFQFHKIDKHSARAIIEFVLWDLYNYVISYGNKNLPKVVVLDEVQNLDLGPDAPVAKYLTEGRKHGLSLITATQTVKGVGGVSDPVVSRLFQAELKLFFKPTENEMRDHAQLLNNAVNHITVKEWISHLANLELGECWVLGRQYSKSRDSLVFGAEKIKIALLEERGFDV